MAVQTEFVQKLLSDPHYADSVRQQALAAVIGGQESPAWETYFGGNHFAAIATDPNKLKALGAKPGAAACTCNSTTVTTTTSPICTGTTTTGSG